MIVADLTELEIMAVLDRGVANSECIAILAHETLNMGQYGIMVGFHDRIHGAFPVQDHLFWFGDGLINSDDWIFVYTGPGKPAKNTTNDGKNSLFSLHWGKRSTIFADTNIVPVLFRVDAVDIPAPPADLPQFGSKGV